MKAVAGIIGMQQSQTKAGFETGLSLALLLLAELSSPATLPETFAQFYIGLHLAIYSFTEV